MAELSLNIIVENINKLKKNLEGIEIGGKAKESSGGGIGVGGAVGIGAAVALLGQLLGSVDSVVKLLDVIGSLINQLVAPFVPILIGLIKPVFVVLQIFLVKMLKMLGVISSEPSEGLNNITDKIGNVAALLVGAIAGIVAIFLGAKVILAVAFALLVAVIGKKAFEIGAKIGAKLAEFADKYIVGPLSNMLVGLINWLSGLLDVDIAGFILSSVENVTIILDQAWEFLKNIFTGNFKEAGQNLKNIFVAALDNVKNIWNFLIDILKGIFRKIGEVLRNVWNGLIDSIKRTLNFFARKFTEGLNGLINILNKIPGVSISRVRGGTPFSGIGNSSGPTTINFTVQGDANENTATLAAQLLRRELNRRGSF